MEGQEEFKKEKEKLLVRARKLKALADRGIGGEKVNAQKKLDEFLLKHGLLLEDVESVKNHRVFTIQFEDDALVLANIIYSINPATKLECTELYVKCILDEEDFKEAVEKYRVFIKLWRKHKEWAITCFMTKHAKYMQMDEYAYEKFTKSSQQKNVDVLKSEEFDSEMVDVTNKLNEGSKFGKTADMLEKEREIEAMNRVLPFMPSVRYFRKFGGN